MDKSRNQILNSHAQRYIREIMSDQLLTRGYVSRNNEGLHWYRIINGNLLQAVYFYSQWAAMPILMGIGYGCHPMFIAPEYPCGIHIGSMMRSHEALNPGRMIMKQANKGCYSNEIAVTCPDDAYHGADILTDILLRMDSVHSIEECYSMHKKARISVMQQLGLPESDAFRNISTDFMDESIYFDDKALYPCCISRITSELERYERAQTVRKLHNVEKADIEALMRLKTAILEDNRETHIHYLQEQERKNLSQLVKKVKGIVV